MALIPLRGTDADLTVGLLYAMDYPPNLFQRYQDLQRYVGWEAEDSRHLLQVGPAVESLFPSLVDDFYQEIGRHPGASKVITGGAEQVARLKVTLTQWLRELFSGRYDEDYVVRRWRVGMRHVEIGLDQVYTNVALSRLRCGLLASLQELPDVSTDGLHATRLALNKLLDLDLAIIEDAYQSVYFEQEHRLLVTAVRDVKEGILITDACLERPGPHIVFVNDALTQITGYSEEEVLGNTPRMFQSPRTDAHTLLRLRNCLTQGQPFTGEVLNRRKDGNEIVVELHISPVHDSQGRVTHYVSTQRDVTARKRSEERLLQSERLAAIGQMVTGLAHESRNALQRSKACLEMLAIEVEDRPEALDLVARVNKAQDHLHHLYEEVRNYAAPLNLHRQKTNLADVWRDAWGQLEVNRRSRNVVLREETGGLNLELHGDAFALAQVFRNILENSLAACADPCEIVIDCMPVLLGQRPALQIAIRDNGPGLTAEQAERIFDPFFTTKTKGTGLGMAIAKRIVDAHGGTIEAGKLKVGAEILITLPREFV